jgi:hypothetical protein
MIERGTKRCGLSEIVVFLGALAGGTLCSLTSKIMLSMKGRGLSGRTEAFSSPLFQTFAMFLSLNLALVIHFASIYFKIPLPGQENEVDHDHDEKKLKSLKKSQMITYILLICPTIFDIAATCLAMAGLMYVSVSIYQILRGKPFLSVFSQNQSPTLVAKLVKVGKVNCVFESVESDYKETVGLVGYKVGVQYKVPTQRAWNSFFYYNSNSFTISSLFCFIIFIIS